MYKEKKFGKVHLIILAIVTLLLGIVSIAGGIVAVINMAHWAKYILVVLLSILGLVLILFACLMLFVSASMIKFAQSVRDGNDSIGIANANLCDTCGRVIKSEDGHCEYCGKKQAHEKSCPECNTNNKKSAQFCTKCGYEFKD